MWVYFLVYPLTNAFLPNLDLGVVEFNPVRIYMLLPLFYLFYIFVKYRNQIIISKESSFMLLYVVYALFNSWVQDHFIMANVLNYTFPVLFIILIENLEFEKDDFREFYRMLSILSVLVFAGSLMQQFVLPSFYSGLRGEHLLYRYSYGQGFFRNASIFRSIGFYQAGMAIGMLLVIFLFLNFKKVRFRYTALSLMMLISTYFTYTRSNWIIPLIALLVFAYFKLLKKKVAIIFILAGVGIVFWSQILPEFQKTETYRERVVAKTYEGRFESFRIYKEYFWGRNLFFGFGIDSRASGAFLRFGRPEAHIGYIEVLYRNGLLGFILYFAFWYYLYKRSKLVYKYTGNGCFIAFIMVFLASNFIFKFINMAHFGYHIMIFYLHMFYQVYVKSQVVARSSFRDHGVGFNAII